MKLPDNPDFYVKFGVCIIVVFGAIVVQTVTGNVPEWLGIAFSAVIVFALGVSTNPRKD